MSGCHSWPVFQKWQAKPLARDLGRGTVHGKSHEKGLEIGHTPHAEPSKGMAPCTCILAQELISVMLLQPPLLLQPGSNCHGFRVNPQTHTIEYSHAQWKPSHPRSLTHVLVCTSRRFTLSESNLAAKKRPGLARAIGHTPPPGGRVSCCGFRAPASPKSRESMSSHL